MNHEGRIGARVVKVRVRHMSALYRSTQMDAGFRCFTFSLQSRRAHEQIAGSPNASVHGFLDLYGPMNWSQYAGDKPLQAAQSRLLQIR